MLPASYNIQKKLRGLNLQLVLLIKISLAAGCIYTNESSSLAILDSNFTNNFGLSAGAIALWNSTVTVNNTLFQNNTCNSAGKLPSFNCNVCLELRKEHPHPVQISGQVCKCNKCYFLRGSKNMVEMLLMEKRASL